MGDEPMAMADFWIVQIDDAECVYPTKAAALEAAERDGFVIDRIRPYSWGEQING
jgi:hypothetical protein